MHLGYTRVSTKDQTIDLQVDALTQAGCTKVYTEVISGARAERPILTQVLETLCAGDVLVIWKLDRLGRSLKHLLEIVTDLMTHQVGLKSLNDPIDTTTPPGILFFGAPGCGKPRLARAIAGELDQEVRLLGPSDLRGGYVGWGQIMIREQFDRVAQHERRMLVIDEIDAVARSRRQSGNMHSDEKANVNELLVQLDRVSHLGRLVVGTTNFITSLDDAVVRSGRFGRFVPVAPPDIDEAIDILNYYLKSLVDHEDTNNQPRVQVPEAEELRSILKPLFAENAAERQFFCGADLEEAVNHTYQRCLRQALGDTWPEEYARVNVNLSPEELTRSLRDVPRSVTEEAVEQFILDIKRYCGSAMASQFEKRLSFEG